jgi:hypothetical protein
LTWIYEEEVVAEIVENVEESTEELTVRPSPKQTAVLYDLAMMGDISGILVALELLEVEEVHLKPFTCKIRDLAKQFKEEQICDLLEQYLE